MNKPTQEKTMEWEELFDNEFDMEYLNISKYQHDKLKQFIRTVLASSQDSFRRKVEEGIDEYFEGLIAITYPQKTKESLKKALLAKLKTL